jgi:protein-disulfide isomerase
MNVGFFRMKRCLLALCLMAALSPAWAQTAAFTPAQRAQIIQVVRDALKADPSILRDAITSLQADDTAREAAESKTRIAADSKELLAKPGDPVAGNPAGDVTIVEFYDPRCPYCRRMVPTIDALLQHDHGVRLIYKDIPVLGPASTTEARAILAAQNQGGYLKMQAALMSNPGDPSDSMIRQTAKSVGLDPAKLSADMAAPAISAKLQQNLALAHDLKVEGTPVFIVGDQLIPGAIDEANLKTLIAVTRKKG